MSRQPTLRAIDEDAGLWAIDVWARSGFHWRSAVIRGPDGLVIVSPTRGTRERLAGELDALGPVRGLIAPNHYHYLGLAEYLDGTTGIAAAASDTATPRITKKAGLELGPLADAAAALPDHVTILEPPGVRSGELWLRVETPRGVAWVISDAFFNMAEHPSGGMGLACRMLGVTRGLRIGRTFTGLALGDRRTYRAWLRDQLAADQPRILVPAHGDIDDADDLPDRLQALADQRLGR